MTTPIRASIHVLGEFSKDDEDMTIRDAIEWFKRAVRGTTGELSAMEHRELNGRWAHLAEVIAKREGVPAGSLSYFMGELAQTEIRLADTVADEAEAAGIDYVKE